MESETIKRLKKAEKLARELPVTVNRLAWIWFWRGVVWGAMMAGGIAVIVANW